MCHLLLERRSKQSITILFVIIYFIAIIYLLLTTLAFWVMKNKMFLSKIKESPPIMRDKSSLNRNISSAALYLFDKVS